MDRDPKGYYSRLFVTPDASDEEIKRKYRRLVKKFHPDANPDDEDAAEEFKKIQEAYETLSDPKKRANYDQKVGGSQSQAPPPQWQQRPGTRQSTPPPPPRPKAPPKQTTPPQQPPRTAPPRSAPPPRTAPLASPVSGSAGNRVPLYIGVVAVVALVWFFGFRSRESDTVLQPGVNWAVRDSSFVDFDKGETNYGPCSSYALTKSLLVYTDGNKGRVLALDPATGKKKWSLENYVSYGDCPAIAKEIGGSLIYDDGDADSGTGLIRIDPTTGQGEQFNGVHLNYIIGDTGIEATGDHTTYYSLPSMSQIASSSCTLGTCPEGFAPGVYVTSQSYDYSDQVVTKLLSIEGKLLWSRTSNDRLELAAYSSDVLVFKSLGDSLGNGSRGLIALDRRTGKEVWSYPRFTLWVVPVGNYFLAAVSASETPFYKLVAIDVKGGSAGTINNNSDLLELSDPQVVAMRGAAAQAVVRSYELNWRVNLSTATATPLVVGSQDLSDASVNFLEAGDSRDLIVLKQDSHELMSVKW